VTGYVDASDITSRLLIPTSEQVPWLPIERFSETIATSRKKDGPHPHVAEEVVAYVLEGFVDHEYDGGKRETLASGSVVVLTAHDEILHELVMQKGRTARWLSLVLRVPWHTEPIPTSVVTRMAGDPIAAADGSVQRPVVGSRARAGAFTGLELTDVEFAKEGTAFFRIGKDRRAVVYVLGGSGSIGETEVMPGQGALVEQASAISLHGSPGYRVALATVPRPPPV
jgi:redox-sensitive bicupin YhaK (pirin superfamily)